MQKEVKFQTEEFVPEWASEYSEKKFTVFSTCFLSTKKNSHELDISEEVLRRDASSILGNFLVAKIEYGDSTSHLPDEIIYGYFPREQEVVFEEVEENGEKIVKACAYCVISKMYGKEFNEIFSYNNLRNTSVEMTVQLPEDDEHNVQGFDIYGLTCLGMTVRGSCPDANMKMVRFSREEAEDFFKSADESNLTPLQTFVKQRRKSMEDNTRKTTVVDKAEEGKEENAKMNEIGFEEKVEAKEEMAETEQEMECKKMEENQESGDSKEEKLEGSKDKDLENDDEDDDEEEEVEMSADEMKAEMARLKAELEDKENIIMDCKTKMGEMETELSELREFKAGCEKKEMAKTVDSLMTEVKDCMSQEQYDKFRDEGLACKMSELDGWSNRVKAFCFENGKTSKSKKKDDGVWTLGAPVYNQPKSSQDWEWK